MNLKQLLTIEGYVDLEDKIRDSVGMAILYAEDIKEERSDLCLSDLCSDVASTILARVDKALKNAKGE